MIVGLSGEVKRQRVESQILIVVSSVTVGRHSSCEIDGMSVEEDKRKRVSTYRHSDGGYSYSYYGSYEYVYSDEEVVRYTNTTDTATDNPNNNNKQDGHEQTFFSRPFFLRLQ